MAATARSPARRTAPPGSVSTSKPRLRPVASKPRLATKHHPETFATPSRPCRTPLPRPPHPPLVLHRHQSMPPPRSTFRSPPVDERPAPEPTDDRRLRNCARDDTWGKAEQGLRPAERAEFCHRHGGVARLRPAGGAFETDVVISRSRRRTGPEPAKVFSPGKSSVAIGRAA